MRWLKKKKIKKIPIPGDKRIIKRFLFLPKTLYHPDLGLQTRWLEFAEIAQEYEVECFTGITKWNNKKWNNY